MTQEQSDLLAEARRRYPEGTMYVPIWRAAYNRTYDSDCSCGDMLFSSVAHEKELIVDAFLGTSVYDSGKWAVITKSAGTINYLTYL